jgi:virulence factor
MVFNIVQKRRNEMTKEQTVRVGVIGTGNIANNMHIPSIIDAPGAELVALCDLQEEKVHATAEKFSVSKTYTNHLKMLEQEELDAVYVLTMPDRICRPILDSLDAGAHVLCEKPPGLNSFQAKTLARKAEETNKNLMVAFNRRHIPIVKKVVDIMREATTITRIHARFYKHGTAAFSGGLLSAFVCDTIHSIDLVSWIADGKPVKAATIETQKDDIVTNAWESVVGFDNGVVGTVSANYMTAGRVHSLEIHGPEASAFVDLGFGGATCSAEMLFHKGGKETYSLAATGEGKRDQISLDGKEVAQSDALYRFYGFYNETLEFISSIQEGRKPACDIEQGVKSLELAEFLLDSRI